MFKEVFHPVIRDFATFANGNCDTACLAAMMATGVFTNDQAMFDRAVDYFQNGKGNISAQGALTSRFRRAFSILLACDVR